MPSFLRTLPLAAALFLAPIPAFAEDPTPHPYAYGILIGNNDGGPGQQPLRYAEEDARRMAQVLRELGRYGTSDLRVLVKPDAAAVGAALDDVAAKLRAHEAKGEQAILVFYYSGHAKANAFNLGAEELPIVALREKLAKLPATLTLVVLDACQSGQFARIKGAEPAADFSFNSVSRLTTKGLAVMASSSAQELSQESDELKGSYFTHHLVTALRGAADADGDGRVSLDEAYRYAYRRTLTSTAQTQVGSQHVTLETDLGGQGDVAMTYPSAAKSQLEIPGTLEARVVVQHKASGSVVAEVQKAKGAPLRLAFAAGAYEAIVRHGNPLKIAKCTFSLSDERVTPLDLASCEEVKKIGVAKGEGDEPDFVREPRKPVEPWSIDFGAGFMFRTEDAFTRRLNEFGYEHKNDLLGIRPRLRVHLGFAKGILPHVSVGAQVHTLEGDEYRRTASDSDDSYEFDAYGGSALVRATTAKIGTDRQWIDFYGQGQLGLTMGVATLRTGSRNLGTIDSSTDTHWGWVLGGFGGIDMVPMPALGFFAQLGYEYAPTIANQIGDVHSSGGASFQLGTRFRFE